MALLKQKAGKTLKFYYSTLETPSGIRFTVYTDQGVIEFAKRKSKIKHGLDDAAKEGLFEYFELCIKHREQMPLADKNPPFKTAYIEISLNLVAKIYFCNLYAKSHYTMRKDLAADLGVDPSYVTRYFDLHIEQQMDRLVNAIKLLGKNLELQLVEDET